MCGIDAGMIQAKKLEGDYGYVGDITHINTEPIENAIANGYIPVIATVGTDLDGNVYNINADTAAALERLRRIAHLLHQRLGRRIARRVNRRRSQRVAAVGFCRMWTLQVP